ncbi:YsnF/AvaK domain-containing protein [Microvirga guangxiensis]|uniref:Conserved domain-containing protein n=1 Tax=Microvirga guangxiensis TaxID=549386 RepID=A0A1G5JIS7_9HYPH|nr:YsnF/AvaK domain-containing protein [Microvirga guangxiensis]SCY87791.1 conserved domain-containing protein [Microvirga guangxiensis]
MAKTVTCLFESEAQASSIVRQLEEAGVSQGSICLFSNTGSNRFWEGAGRFDENRDASDNDRVEHYLRDNGVPSDDAYAYAEGVRRGHALVAVRCEDDEVDRVVDILDNDNVLDIDERQDAWRSEGWSGYGSGVADLGASPTTSAGMLGRAGLTGDGSMRARDSLQTDSELSSSDRMYADDDLQASRRQTGDEVIPVAEEELHVGKREVGHGRVRIRSHVVERPVQEQVTLREEHVQVERRPVEGSMRAGTVGDSNDLFRERTIEMEERAEEAVVNKEARVVEEVVVRKDVDQRTETVSDTVRKTEVEVDDERRTPISKTGTTDTER